MKRFYWSLAICLPILSFAFLALEDPFNTPPIFVAPTDTQVKAYTEKDFELPIEVEDIDHDIVQVTAHGLPEWMHFDAYHLKLYGRPAMDDKNEYVITIKATDGKVLRTKMLTVDVDYGHSAQQHFEDAFQVLSKVHTDDILSASAAVVTPEGQLHATTYGRSGYRKTAALTSDHQFRIASVSKLFTATLVLKMAEQGYLGLDDKAIDYIDMGTIPNKEDISIRQLLSHTAGLSDHLNHNAFYHGNWKSRKWTDQDIVNFAGKRSARFEPGEGYAYSNTGFYLLGMIIENVLKMPLKDAFEQWLFKPFQLENTFLDESSTRSKPIPLLAENARAYEYHLSSVGAAGAIVSTPTDMARFGHALYSGEIISPEWLDEMIQNEGDKNGGDNYGLGTRLWDDYGIIHYGHTGLLMGYRAILLYLPEYKVTIAMASNDLHGGWHDLVNSVMLEMAEYYR